MKHTQIERWALGRYLVEPCPKEGGPYLLAIPYETDEELDRIIYEEIWTEAENLADARHCFTEGDCISVDDPDRHW